MKVRDWIDLVFVKKRFYSADAQYAPSVSRTQVSLALPVAVQACTMHECWCMRLTVPSCVWLSSLWAALGRQPPATASMGSGCQQPRQPATARLQARHVPP